VSGAPNPQVGPVAGIPATASGLVFPPDDVGQVQVAAVEALLRGGGPLDLVIGDESVRLPVEVREALAHVTRALRAGQAVIVLPSTFDMPSELRKQ